jgi:periplasmic divalent cation tolerance protein
MSEIATVYATFADAEEAERIARTLVEERLAACANILGPCRSIYRWEGAIEDTSEMAVLFKTRADLARGLIERLAALHSYEVPAATVWPIAATLPGYRKWVLDSTG